MSSAKIAISLDKEALRRLDSLVKAGAAPSRSKLIQDAIEDRLARLHRQRLADECAKLEPQSEQALADEGLDQDATAWPPY